MGITQQTLREKYAQFWSGTPRAHKAVPPAPLVLSGDATTLFTSSGMQPLVPYLMGESHPLGSRLYNIQPCFRGSDIEEVGDNRHTTFFEMMGNWSLGDYFKEEQLAWCLDFFVKEIGLPIDKLHVTVYEGGQGVDRDEQSASLWKKLGMSSDRIYYYGAAKNWWSRSGTPDKMPVGEIGGPDSEVFYEFDVPHDKRYGKECHPNCDCGKFLEIGNSVFIQYKKDADGTLAELSQKNVDYGGGLERILAASANDPDIFNTDVFLQTITAIEGTAGKQYADETVKPAFRVIADHIRVAVFLIKEGVIPSNKEHGYILRRLLRRAAIKMRQMKGSFDPGAWTSIARAVLSTYEETYFNVAADTAPITSVIDDEMKRFAKSIDQGIREIQKVDTITGKIAFDVYQSFGFPVEITRELATEKGQQVNVEEFRQEFEKHKERSRTASAGKFKGGLADHSDQVVKYHTATHLLHQALRDVFGASTRQEGSNITQERLRFDATLDHKPTEEEIGAVESIMNQKVNEKLPVYFKILPKADAIQLGAVAFFREKYGDDVKVYFIGGHEDDLKSAYSMEFCGGPHVSNTGEIGPLRITKTKKIGANLVRMYVE